MSDKPAGTWLRRAWTVAVALLLLYPFSTGPLIWLQLHGWLPENAQAFTIDLVEWEKSHSPTPVYRWLEWYIGLWVK